MIGKALSELSKLTPDAFDAVTSLGLTAVQALAEWLDGADVPEPVGALNRLPSVLSSELALERAEKRAADAAKG